MNQNEALQKIKEILEQIEEPNLTRHKLLVEGWINLGKSISSLDCDLWIAPTDAGFMSWGEAMKSSEPWMRLPTRGEFRQMYVFSRLHGGGFKPLIYWSSRDNDKNNAWCQQFSDGAQGYFSKNHSYAVRYVTTIKREQQ
jgi:hypothetical protein